MTTSSVVHDLMMTEISDNSSSPDNDRSTEHVSEEGDSEEDTILHTLPFKVMGVAHKLERQKHLEAAFIKMNEENVVIKAKIQPEPDNMYDANAIAVLIDYGLGYKQVGYISQDLTKFVHSVLNRGRLQHASVYNIKFRTTWAKAGFYMTLQLTSKGEWPAQVLRASTRVQ